MEKVALSISQVLRKVPISRSTLYKEIAAGRIKSRKIGARTVILSSDLETYLDTLRDERGDAR